MKNSLRIAMGALVAAILLVVAVILLYGWFAPFLRSILADSSSPVKRSQAHLASEAMDRELIILDPGHGGEDPGAVGLDGVFEKDLNLSVALRLRDLLIFNGYEVVMTRSDDRLLYDPDLSTSHKVQDLATRLDYGKLYPNATFISIHMNKFPDSDCSGLQVYYSGNNPLSQSIADSIEKEYMKMLPESKERACKQATSSIFILHRIEIPAVLVECGFLSNQTENELLQSAEYQKKLAVSISLAISENDLN